jgi:hypothetical protein
LFLGNQVAPLVSPDQARAVVAAFWPLREDALNADDTARTDELESGVAREYDDAVSFLDLQVYRGAPRKGLRRVRTYSNLAVFVPRQEKYPITFMAQVQTGLYVANETAPAASPYVEMMVFRRDDAASHWKLVYDTGYQGTQLEAPASPSADGFAASPTTPSWIAVASVPGLLASYWQHWKDTGTPPPQTPFLPGYWTSERGPLIARDRQNTFDNICHCLVRSDYRADPERDGLYVFGVQRGGRSTTLACSTVRIRESFTPARADETLVQDQARNQWEPWLAPGDYRHISVDSLRQSCVAIGQTRAEGLAVIGGNGEYVNATGVSASPGAAIPLGSSRSLHVTHVGRVVWALAAGMALGGVALVAGILVAIRLHAKRTPRAVVAPSAAPGWYTDPQNWRLLRYWDGQTWTSDVRDPGGGF